METVFSPAPFDLTGGFGGFVFTAAGKRRLVLRVGEQDYLLKVPRLLRRRVIGTFRAGQSLRVIGHEEHGGDGGVTKRVVAQIVPAGVEVAPPAVRPATACTIKVCAKKNCWRRGGQELFKALKQGAPDGVEVKAVGCLDRCDHAPNVDTPWREYRRCTERDAPAILAEVAVRLR